MTTLNRDAIIDGLRDVIRELHRHGEPTSIRIIGGAAILLRYDADRRVTVDIDASIHTNAHLDEIVATIAARRGWPRDWLNNAARTFIPIAAEPLWEPLHDDGVVSIDIATPGSLLAMKLRAARPQRDGADIALLMRLLNISTVDEAEAVFEHYFPGELPPDKAYPLVESLLAQGLPPAPDPPANPHFGDTRPGGAAR